MAQLSSDEAQVVEPLQEQFGDVAPLRVGDKFLVLRVPTFDDYEESVDGLANPKLADAFVQKRMVRKVVAHCDGGIDGLLRARPFLTEKLFDRALLLAGNDLEETLARDLPDKFRAKAEEALERYGEIAVLWDPDTETLICVKCPSAGAHDQGYEIAGTGKQAKAQRALALSTVVVPDLDEFKALLERKPAYVSSVSTAAKRLGAGEIEDLGKS